jgi:NTE family protein
MLGCAHPANQRLKQVDPQSGYQYMGMPGNSEHLLLYLTFSGGGTRAALAHEKVDQLREVATVSLLNLKNFRGYCVI